MCHGAAPALAVHHSVHVCYIRVRAQALVQPSDMCAKPALDADWARTWHHSVQLHGLKPGSTYTYCPEASRWCSRFRANLAGGAQDDFTFVFFGDMGVGGFKKDGVRTPGCAPRPCLPAQLQLSFVMHAADWWIRMHRSQRALLHRLVHQQSVAAQHTINPAALQATPSRKNSKTSMP
jgi:hypothetical protein